jgi:ATPase subunit of ABC transporter with duplicated ATPase domains
MINAANVALSYGKRVIFLAGNIEPDRGEITVGPRQRIAVLNQDQFAFDEETVFNTVVMGHNKLFKLMAEREALYAKTDFTEEDGIRSGELEAEFGEMNGYEAESEAAALLNGLGIPEAMRHKKMKELEGGDKVRVLLAQALFGNPDILLLDEPTNHLDLQSITWLQDFLARFQNTVIIVSHDRHFLNQVCTHMADIDYGKIQVYVGNYDFWYEASQLHFRQQESASKKVAAKAKELKDFIQRFSSNASKAKQATSRKKLLEKLTIEDMPVSSRKYPYIVFQSERPCGDVILEINGLSKSIDGVSMFQDLTLTVNKGDKIAFVGQNSLAKTTLFQILAGELEPDSGSFRWGVTIKSAYFPKEHSYYFDNGEQDLISWLGQFSPTQNDQRFLRGFLGKMLFSGEEAMKKTAVLSGGEKVRCMLAKTMLTGANTLMLDEPTNHLDLESITALNQGLMAYSEVVLFASHDHQFVSTVANRIVELKPEGCIDAMTTFDDYLASREIGLHTDGFTEKEAA